jgi:L-2-hydroxyglutarate oxidase
MNHETYDFAIIGGGLLGLATAKALIDHDSKLKICVLEKEPAVAQHQSGRNSGVIHSGIYYSAESFKQRLTSEGRAALFDFCKAEEISFEQCGKILLAQNEVEIPRLKELANNALQNGLQAEILDEAEIRKIEPNARGLAGIYLPEAAIIDYSLVAQRLSEALQKKGVRIIHNFRVSATQSTNTGVELSNNSGRVDSKFVVNCAGLFSDQVASILGAQPTARIIPFRGQYFHLKGAAKSLVKALIYPLPDPQHPFLGVHLSRTMDGAVIAGPNAVLSLKREGYSTGDVSVKEAWEIFSYPGFWRFGVTNFNLAANQYFRAWNQAAFASALQALVPAIRLKDLKVGRSGVRAQAMSPDGKLIKDFAFDESPSALHVINAPSPGATASLAIGKHIAEKTFAKN